MDVIWLPNDQFASCSDDRTIRIWQTGLKAVESPSELAILQSHNSRVWELLYIPSSNTLVSCSEDTTAKIWDLSSFKLLDTLTGHTGKSVWSVAYSEKHSMVATGGSDSGIKLWPISTVEDQLFDF